jgi:hypothetical protein
MKNRKLSRFATLSIAAGLVFCSFQASPEDIDIFSVDENGIVARPNVLIVLDNSANWSRQAQQWPDGDAQGRSEADAIREVLKTLNSTVNLGLMVHITGGGATDQDSGYVRYHIRPMSGDVDDPATNKGALAAKLTTISNNINDPTEKRAQGNPFGDLMWDVYNYLAGADHSNGGTGTPATLADLDAYSDQVTFKAFQSPLTAADTCTRTVVIFIGNNTSSGPTVDDNVNKDALATLAGGGAAGTSATTQLQMAEYAVSTQTETDILGNSDACYDSVAACTSALAARDLDNNGLKDCTEAGYESCACNAALGGEIPCPSASKFTVTGFQKNTTVKVLRDEQLDTANNVDTGDIVQVCKSAGQGAGLNSPLPACPAESSTTSTDAGTGETTKITTTWSNCQYNVLDATGCGVNKFNYQKQGTKTRHILVTTLDETIDPTGLGMSAACYESAGDCNNESGGKSASCSSFSEGCTCDSPTTTTGCATGSTFREEATYTFEGGSQTGRFVASPGQYMMDEWARFLRQTGVLVPGGGARSQVTTYTIDVFQAQQDALFSSLLFNAARVGGGKYFQAKDEDSLVRALLQILTEVQAVNSAFSSASLPVNATNRAQNQNQVFIGVFKPDKDKLPRWFGNLKQYQLVSTGVTVELGDKNKNPAVNEQTGFITECAESFWTTDSIFKHPISGLPTGYWQDVNIAPLPVSDCSSALTIPYSLSDMPDGPFVEKGAAAEVLRKGNNPAASPDGDGNYELDRKVYTVFKGALDAFSIDTTGLDEKFVKFELGEDINDEDGDGAYAALAYTEPRASIHGDVVHSRPQPLNYGGTTEVVIYYGSNDGHYRAVEAKTGRELWSFVAPEHFDRLARLYDNGPEILYFGDVDAPPEFRPKEYFFDGSTGVFQTFKTITLPDGTTSSVGDVAYIFPTMRRGGAKVYAFDVSNPTTRTPDKYLWSKGCAVDYKGLYGTCDDGFDAIGQTWSVPNVAFIKGYCGASDCTTDAISERKPVVVFGGGYDTCDDEDTPKPCGATRGRGVYVLDATDGTLLSHIDFSAESNARGIAADVALIDVNNDKMVDFGYALDTGGSVYRIDFVDGSTTSYAAFPKEKWFGGRVAYTANSDDPRKFLFAPALVQANSSTVYVAVGSGDREHPLMGNYPFGTLGDADSAILNRFYVFKDLLGDDDGDPLTADSPLDLDDTNLMADYTGTNSCDKTTFITPNHPKRGWYIDLNANGQGEQVVTSAVIAAGFVFFSTNRPTDAADAAVCTTSLGEARGYFLNLFNGSGAIGVTGNCGGTSSSTFVGGGLPPSPVLATVPIDGELTTVCIGCVQKTGEPSSPIEAQHLKPPIPAHRKPIYWYKSTGDK